MSGYDYEALEKENTALRTRIAELEREKDRLGSELAATTEHLLDSFLRCEVERNAAEARVAHLEGALREILDSHGTFSEDWYEEWAYHSRRALTPQEDSD